ncbi:MAG: HesA/MoeB/ThiF family protein [Candidatus Helarchaeota archaeon]|nr:HesA/MoeB/ThiF family protein [Candidatus Helarchaeota archaeon]
MFGFTKEEIRRYSRQIVLKRVGGKGQKKLRESSVLVVGAGGLGCPVSVYLTAAGIGKLGLLDFDVVDISNLQRQILHFTKDVGEPKTISAAEKLRSLNPNIIIQTIETRLTPKNAREIVKQYDYVIDGSDNFATKYIINDACIIENIPFTIAGILKFEGQILTVIPKQTSCYRCIFPAPPPPGMVPSCSQAGVFGAIPGIIGSIQASETIKYLLDFGKLITNGLLLIDIENLYFQKVSIQKNNNCRACGETPEDLLKVFDYYQGEICET